MSARIIVGIDYYYSDYNSDRKNGADAPPFHRYNAYQHTAAAYIQNTVAVSARTDAHFGVRLQYQRVAAGDVTDTSAPGGAFAVQADSLDAGETEYALNEGLEYRGRQ